MSSLTRLLVTVLLLFLSTGCWSERAAPEAMDPIAHNPAAHDMDHGHDATHHHASNSQLIISTDPEEVRATEPVELRMMIHGADGTMVTDFDVIHEKQVHLIIVRDDLGTFEHIHQDVDDSGNLTAELSFPTGGRYLLYADHQPSGLEPSLARGELNVTGDRPSAQSLEPNVPGEVVGDDVSAGVAVDERDDVTEITFDLTDSSGAPVDDLEPYLGAMGHLVVISEDGKQYVHAHPLDHNPDDAGRVTFAAHFMEPGLYKGWGQFLRRGAVETIPFVMAVDQP